MEALKTKHGAPQTADVKAAATSSPSRSSSQPRRRKTRRSSPEERPPVPAWMLDTPMHSKIPLVGAPNGKIMLYTTALCEKLFETPTSLKFDPSPQGLDMMYRSLHDPHLRGYFTHPKMYSHLRKSGFLTPCGMVKCGLKQFNEYHQYVKQIHLEKLTQERRQMMKKTRSRDDRSSHGHQHHKLNHRKRLTPTWTDSWHKAAYRPAKHQRRASSTKSISSPPLHEKKSEKIRSASKQKSISKTKTIRDGVMKAHTALEHRRKAGKSGTGQRVVKTQAHERQFLQLKKRLDEEMEREKELERRKIITKAKREMKLEEQWERREIVHELQQAQEDDQRHEDETKSGKVKVMRRRMAEAHRAKQQGSPHVFESIRDARAKLVAEREAIIARRLDKRLYKIREKYNRRHRRQMAIYRQTTKILNGKLQDHEEQLDARKTSRKHRDVNAEAANASTPRLLSLIHSTSRDSISSSNESFVFTPLVKEKPVISITDQVLSVTSLDYRQSPECRAEEQTGPVSIMQDVYLADESGEEEGNTKTQERDREHLVSAGKGVAVNAWPERDHDDGEEAGQSLHGFPEDSDERSSIGTKSTSPRGSTLSSNIPDKLIQGTVGSGNEREEPGSEDDENGEDAAEEEYSVEEDGSWTDSEFWESESDTNLVEENKPTAVEEDKVISEEIEQETKKENENTQQEQQEEKNQPSSTRKVKVKDAEKLELEREEENSEEASKSQFAEGRLGTAQDFQAEEVVNKTECPDEVTENQCTMEATSEQEKDDGREHEGKANKIVTTVLEGFAIEINSKDNNCRFKKLCRQIDTEGSRQEECLGDKIDQGEDTQTGTNEEENVEKLESDSILLANVMDIFEEVEQEMHHHHHQHNHEQHHHEEHHHHQEHLPEAEQDEDKKQTESECSSSSCSSSSSSESEEEGGDIIGVVENEIIAEETSVTSLKGCLSGKFVTGLQEVVKETENHRKVFEGAVMPARHHSATSSASSKVSINVTAAVLSADSLKVDSSGKLIHQDVESHEHTKPVHKISATDIPTDDKPAAAHVDESASKESSHHHYSDIVPIYHNNLIHVSEDLIDSNLSAISMKPDRHHRVPSSYSAGSRNSFRNIFRPDMTFCQGSAKCLKDTLVQELSKHSKHSKHSSGKMDEYCGILDVEQEDVTAHHSDEELVTIEETEGVCYLPKGRLFKARHTIEEPVSEQDEEEVPKGGHITGVSNAAVSAEERQASECSDDTGKPPNLMGNCQSDPTCEQRKIKDESETNEGMEASTDHPDDQSDDASPDKRQTKRNETQVLDDGITSHEAGPSILDDQRDARTLENGWKRSHSEEGNIEDLPVLDEVKDIQTPEGVLTNGPCEVNSSEGVNIREQDNNGQQARTDDLAIRCGQNNTCDEEPTNRDRDEMADSGEPASSDGQINGETPANKVEQTDSRQPPCSGELEPGNGFEQANKKELANTGERAAIDEENIISGEPRIEEQANSRESTTKEEASRGEQTNSKEPTNEDHGQLADDGEQANNRKLTSSGKRTNDEEQAKCDKLSDGEGKATKANSEEQANSAVHTGNIQQGQTQPERDSRPGSSQASQLSFIPSTSISGGDDLVSSSSSFDEIGAQSPLPNCVPESFYIGTSDDSTLGAAATRSAALVKDAAPVPNIDQSHQDSIDPEPGFHSPPLKEVSSHPSPSQSKSGSSHKSGSMLSTVIRKLSSVLSVGRRRSSRVHPGDDISAETKMDTTEAEGTTEQDQ